MTLQEALDTLKSLGIESVRAHNRKFGAGDNQYGTKLGDIRKLAAKIKTDHQSALDLYHSGIIDAQLLAILLIKPKQLSSDELDRIVRAATFSQVADWVNAYLVKEHPEKETLRVRWMADADPSASGWVSTATIRPRRGVRRRSRRSGSTRWCGGRGKDGERRTVNGAREASSGACAAAKDGWLVIHWLYFGMKTAISLPDPLFKAGDQLAKRLGVTRSELYARALAEFVAKQKASQYTERLNAVYDAEESRLDPAAIAGQARALPRESW